MLAVPCSRTLIFYYAAALESAVILPVGISNVLRCPSSTAYLSSPTLVSYPRRAKLRSLATFISCSPLICSCLLVLMELVAISDQLLDPYLRCSLCTWLCASLGHGRKKTKPERLISVPHPQLTHGACVMILGQRVCSSSPVFLSHLTRRSRVPFP